MESPSSDEDDYQMEFWNNWMPSSTQKSGAVKYLSHGRKVTKTRETFYNFSRVYSFHSIVENSKFGNWIPPLNFLNGTSEDVQHPKTSEKHFQSREETPSPGKKNEVVKEIREKMEMGQVSSSVVAYRKYVNLDWGERRQLHDVTCFINDGGLIWGVVHLGVFGNIKLWVNEYNHICCIARGRITKLGCLGTTFICITDTELLRKMLNVPSNQWSSLCETVKESKTALNFDAFQDFELAKRTPLERLWLFICKRRHFLPRQSMLLKYSGAVKCMRRLDIIPRLSVQDIRNIAGEPGF